MAGRGLWFALPTGVVVLMGASTLWIAQRVPRFLFPAPARSLPASCLTVVVPRGPGFLRGSADCITREKPSLE